MVKCAFCLILGLMLAACGAPAEPEPTMKTADAPAAEPAAPSEKWAVTMDIDAPESAYVDPGTGDVFVSIIAGMPNEKDGNGRIARIGADGTVKSTSWATGLNAPKGLRSHDGTLWTSDIDEMASFDIATGKPLTKIKVPGAQFLNDVAVGSDGTVYVTDMLGSKIYSIKDGKPAVVAEGEDLEYPNGLLVEGDALIVGGWGKPEADFTTKVPGRLFRIDLKTKAKTLITPEPTANIDGLESDGKGGYVATDYVAGKVLHIGADGHVDVVGQYMPGTADIGMAASQGLLIIPHMNENKVVAYDVSSVVK